MVGCRFLGLGLGFAIWVRRVLGLCCLILRGLGDLVCYLVFGFCFVAFCGIGGFCGVWCFLVICDC